MEVDKGLPNNLSSEKINQVATALAKAQGQITEVKKNGKNPFFQNAPYALYEDIKAAIRPVAADNGLAILHRFEDGFMHTLLLHSSGEWLDCGSYNLGEAKKHQERGSAITYAKRYVEASLFGVAPEVDDDANTGNEDLKPRKETSKAKNERFKEIAAAIEHARDTDTLARIWADNHNHIKAFRAGDQEIYDNLERLKDERKAVLKLERSTNMTMDDDLPEHLKE